MAAKTILLLISFVLGILSIRLIRSYDIHEKEPVGRMLTVTALGGIVSIITALGLYELIDRNYEIEIMSAFGAFVVIGPIEEFAKIFGLFVSYFVIRKQLDEPLDGIIYISCVALGFSLVENYFYAISEPDLSSLIIVRLITATPGHLMFSASMGLAFYFYKKKKTPPTFLFIAYLYGSLMHGLWDSVLFEQSLAQFAYLVVFILVLLMYRNLILILNYSAAKSPFRKSLLEFVESYKEPKIENGIQCLNCGNVDAKKTFKLSKIKVQKCVGCANYVTGRDSLFYIFHHFGARFQNLTKHYFKAPVKHKELDVLFSCNFISSKHKVAYFDLKRLNAVLEDLNNKSISELETKWWFQSYARPDRSFF